MNSRDTGITKSAFAQTFIMEDGNTVRDLVQKAGIDEEEIKVAFVNSNVVALDTALSEGDRVGLAPAVGGM